MTLHRPTPHPLDLSPIATGDADDALAKRLIAGETLLLRGRWGRGVAIGRAVDTALSAPEPSAPFEVRQAHQAKRHEVLQRLRVPVRGHVFAVGRAPACGFLAELYPKKPDFALAWTDAIDLVRAWKRYDEGVPLAVIGGRIHPFYGTYAPTRTEHLELFATWLSGYKGPRDRAVDVGTGSGVLARMLARAGFAEVVATDLNPNAVESVRRELVRQPAPIAVHEGDLLAPVEGSVDLVAFNPPWTRGVVNTPLDRALVYEDGLFERFFDQAAARLNPGGRVVLVFSNVIRLVQEDEPHPIDAELARGRFTLVDKLHRRVKASKGRKTREKVEVWELALA